MNKPILLVEDEDSDVIFMRMAMEHEGVTNSLPLAVNGREAIAYFKGEGSYADRQKYPLPGLVLLDLRLPIVPGLKVLEWIRQQPAFATLPVFILSSSDQDADVEAAYRLGAQAYLVKPPLIADLTRIVGLIKKYWIDSNAPPPGCEEWQALIVPRPQIERLGGGLNAKGKR